MFPASLAIALPCSLVAVALKILVASSALDEWSESDTSVLNNNGAWSGFSFLVGFLIVFRTSQAYSRFWDGCVCTHQMRAEWFDSCAGICAFCTNSKKDLEEIMNFKHLLIRLFSMLHAAALADIEDCSKDSVEYVKAFSLPLIDIGSIDAESLRAVKTSDCRVELIFAWIQQLVVVNIETGVLAIPPPILSRAFQELSNGMVALHQAMKIATIPFPFPYAQSCDYLLLMHWVVVPFVVAQWSTHPVWAGVFAFVQVFVLWSLNFIAVEIENPFGSDANDLDFAQMQGEVNKQLLLLVSGRVNKLPRLVMNRNPSLSEPGSQDSSFLGAWTALDGESGRRPTRTVKRGVSGGWGSESSQYMRQPQLPRNESERAEDVDGSSKPDLVLSNDGENDEIADGIDKRGGSHALPQFDADDGTLRSSVKCMSFTLLPNDVSTRPLKDPGFDDFLSGGDDSSSVLEQEEVLTPHRTVLHASSPSETERPRPTLIVLSRDQPASAGDRSNQQALFGGTALLQNHARELSGTRRPVARGVDNR